MTSIYIGRIEADKGNRSIRTIQFRIDLAYANAMKLRNLTWLVSLVNIVTVAVLLLVSGIPRAYAAGKSDQYHNLPGSKRNKSEPVVWTKVKNTSEDTRNVRVIAVTQYADVKNGLRSKLNNTGKPLYQLSSRYIKRPLIIFDWGSKVDKDVDTDKYYLQHRIVELGKRHIYIAQEEPFNGNRIQCRVFDIKQQKLLKPKSCIQGNTIYFVTRMLEPGLLVIAGSTEGYADLILASWSVDGGQKNLLTIKMGSGNVDIRNIRFKNGELTLEANCDIVKGCDRTADYSAGIYRRYRWTRASGLEYD